MEEDSPPPRGGGGGGKRGRPALEDAEDTAIAIDDDDDLFSWDHHGYRCSAVADHRRVRPATPLCAEALKPVVDLTEDDFAAIATVRQQNRREALRVYTLKYLPHFVAIEDLRRWSSEGGREFDYHGQFAAAEKSTGGSSQGRRATQQERQYGTAKAYTQPKKRPRAKKAAGRRPGGARFKRKTGKKKASA